MPRFVFVASIDPPLLGVHHGGEAPRDEVDDEEDEDKDEEARVPS
jgi:hypothetical protein